MKFITELGLMYQTPTSKKKTRVSLYECPRCLEQFKMRDTAVKVSITGLCISCAQTTHGDTKTRLFKCWDGMLQRCSNPNNKSYSYYGGKGISVCREWLQFETYKLWSINNGYAEELTLDRLDSSKGYYPANCRWTTRSEQTRNIGLRITNTTGFIGITLRKGRYAASIYFLGTTTTIGTYDTAIEAAQAYNNYCLKQGLTHRLNVIIEEEDVEEETLL